MDTLFAGFMGAVIGAVIGAVLHWRFTKSQRKEQIALDTLNYFLGIYSDIAEAEYYLQNPQLLKDIAKQNKVRKVGDWMNLIAVLNSRNSLDKDILERCGVAKEMRTFHTFIKNSMAQSNVFKSAWQFWPDLDNFCN